MCVLVAVFACTGDLVYSSFLLFTPCVLVYDAYKK